MKLEVDEAYHGGDVQYRVFALVNEHADRGDFFWQALHDAARFCRSDVARAGRIKIEAQEVGARFDGAACVFPVRDSANFDFHFRRFGMAGSGGSGFPVPMRRRKDSPGSLDFITPSPIRNASKPAERRRTKIFLLVQSRFADRDAALPESIRSVRARSPAARKSPAGRGCSLR